MKFLFPSFLWALSFLAIPIIIHLFNFRKFKKVIFPNVRMLMEVQVQQKSKQRLRKFLVLLARCLALAFLVFAFARPFIPGHSNTGQSEGNVVSIYIDNSFSMNAQSSEGDLISVAKKQAEEIAMAYRATDRFQLLTNEFKGIHQRTMNREDFMKEIYEVEVSPFSRKMSEIYQRQLEVLQRSENQGWSKIAYQLTDLQQSMADAKNVKGDTSVMLYLLPLKPTLNDNISIDTAYVSTPYIQAGKTISLQVKLSNFGSEDVEQGNLTLQLNGQQKGLASFNLKAGEKAETEIKFTIDEPGRYSGQLEIMDHPVVFDDKLFVAFEVKAGVNILEIKRENGSNYVKNVFATDNYFNYRAQNIQQVNYAAFGENSLIICTELNGISGGLIEELKKFVEAGGTLVLIPPADKTAINDYNLLCQNLGLAPYSELVEQRSKVTQINEKHPIYESVLEQTQVNTGLPELSKYWKTAGTIRGRYDYLLRMNNGDDLLRNYPLGKGKVLQWSASLDPSYGNLALNFIFPVTLLNAAIISRPVPALYSVVGSSELVELDVSGDKREHIPELAGESETIIPELIAKDNRYFMSLSGINHAGIYKLGFKGEKEIKGLVAVNYNRDESVNETKKPEELTEELSPGTRADFISSTGNTLVKTIKQLDQGTQLWKWCIVLGLLFLAIEILLLRFLK